MYGSKLFFFHSFVLSWLLYFELDFFFLFFIIILFCLDYNTVKQKKKTKKTPVPIAMDFNEPIHNWMVEIPHVGLIEDRMDMAFFLISNSKFCPGSAFFAISLVSLCNIRKARYNSPFFFYH